MSKETVPEHWHLGGSGCCSHPDCLRAENKRVDKARAIELAAKIRRNRHHESDVQELADLTTKLLT
jgi:hypothetical protein